MDEWTMIESPAEDLGAGHWEMRQYCVWVLDEPPTYTITTSDPPPIVTGDCPSECTTTSNT